MRRSSHLFRVRRGATERRALGRIARDYRANHDEATGANHVAATTVWTGTYANAFEDDAELNYCPQYLPAEY
jgi:hypothetical protein